MAGNFHGFTDAVDDMFNEAQRSLDEIYARGAAKFGKIADRRTKAAAAALAGVGGVIDSSAAGLFTVPSYYGEYAPKVYERTGQLGAAVVAGSGAQISVKNHIYLVTVSINAGSDGMSHSGEMTVTRTWKRKKTGDSVNKSYTYPANEGRIVQNFWNGKHGYAYTGYDRTSVAEEYVDIIGDSLEDDYEYIANTLFD